MAASILNAWRKTEFSETTVHTLADYPVSAGSGRLLVVVLAWEHETYNSTITSTVVYGGETLTKSIEKSAPSASRSQGAAIHYLKDADFPADDSISVAFSATPGNLVVYVACYDGVHQTTTIVDTDGEASLGVVGTISLSVTRDEGGVFIGVLNSDVDSENWIWDSAYTDIFGTSNARLAASLAARNIYNSGTETSTAILSNSGYEHKRIATAAIMLGAAETSQAALGSISDTADATASFSGDASKEEVEIIGSASASDAFFPIQGGDEGQYVDQFFYKGQVVYASDMNRMSDNVRLVRTSETSSMEPINKVEGAFWLDTSETSSLQMRITVPGDQLITTFVIDPVNHTPDFSVAVGGNHFEEYSLGTSKIGSGQLTNEDFADGAFTKDKIYQRSQYRFAANAIGSGTLAQNAVDKTKISSGALLADNWALQTASVSGSSSNVTITLNKFSLMPDFRSSSTNMRLAGHNTTSNPDSPKIRLDGNGTSYSYDVSWYYIDDS